MRGGNPCKQPSSRFRRKGKGRGRGRGPKRDKNKKNKSAHSQSFNAIKSAFTKIPKWKKKELAAQKRKTKKRNEMIDSIKQIAADDFDEDAFTQLFDNDDGNKDTTPMDKNKNKNNDNNKNNKSSSNKKDKTDYGFFGSWDEFDKKPQKHQSQNKNDQEIDNNDTMNPSFEELEQRPKKNKRKRLSQRKRKLLYESQQSPSKKRKVDGNDDEKQEENYKDEDFEDKGIEIRTIHSKKEQKETEKQKPSTEDKKEEDIKQKRKKVMSQIHRFELTDLMIRNIPSDYDEEKLNNYLLNACSIECVDIYLFHNVKDEDKPSKAMISFGSPNNCALAFSYLFNRKLSDNLLSVKGISKKHKKPINDNKTNKFDDDLKQNENEPQNKTKIIKMSNLHWKTTEQDIIDFFSSINMKPDTIHIHITQEGYTNGEAKVEFKNHKLVKQAVDKLNDHKILNRNIKLEQSVTKQIFTADGIEFKNKTVQIAIFNISKQIEEDDLREFIKSKLMEDDDNDNDNGPEDVHLIHHTELFTTGYAFCKFGTHEITNKVVEKLNGENLGDRKLRVIWSKPSKPRKLRKELEGKTKVITMTNLKYNVTNNDIMEFIQNEINIHIHKVDILANAKGYKYGMAKVWLSSYEHAASVVNALNGKLLKDRTVNMNYWEERRANKGKGRGRGFTAGRGRGRGRGFNSGRGRGRGNNRPSYRSRSRSPNKHNTNNKNRKMNNRLGWNDDWFKKNVDGKNDTGNNDKRQKDVKVPQRLLDQLIS